MTCSGPADLRCQSRGGTEVDDSLFTALSFFASLVSTELLARLELGAK